MDTSDLAKRMKEYEKAGQRYLTRRMPVLLRYFLEQEVTEYFIMRGYFQSLLKHQKLR